MNFITKLEVRDLAEEEYYFHIPAIRELRSLDLSLPITFFTGENGSGKSTLLEAIAVSWGFNPEGGSLQAYFTTKDTHSSLCDSLILSKSARRPKSGFFLRAESFYNVASYLEEVWEGEIQAGYQLDHYGGIPHQKSHGQAFMGLLLHHFKPNSLYLLDEPEAALSPQNQLAMMRRIYELALQGSQFIIATHSPILTTLPHSRLYYFDREIKEMDYRESENYRLTKMMLEDPDHVLHYLLKE